MWGQGIRVAGCGGDGTGRQAALEAVGIADEELEHVVEDVAGAWGTLGEVGSGEKAHCFSWKGKKMGFSTLCNIKGCEL